MEYLNIATYKFCTLTDLKSRRESLRQLCEQVALRGTILLATEGINLFVAGERPSVEKLLEILEADAEIGPLDVKESYTDHQPFTRMLVKIKREIISFGVEGISPAEYTSRKISPTELKRWLDERRDVKLLDTRNDYEVKLGTFENAHVCRIDHFREFPKVAEQLPEEWREQPLVMFCTGGIRCEKAGPLMERLGFRNVFQLDGGILRYFEEVGQDHYRGDCFVFDQRVAVDAALRETNAAQCYACQAILTPEEQATPQYVEDVSCPYCYQAPDEELAATLGARHARLREVATPLPGSVAYDNTRPLYVASRHAGLAMLDFLVEAVPVLDRSAWLKELDAQRILRNNKPVDATYRVTPGERFEHLIPGVVEPTVNADIEILHEDSAIVVVNKPAPLPMHPSGRFNKNTLGNLLAEVYAPERLRHAHRLDANTTGVVLFSRSRRIALRIQSQFARGEVEKVYLAKVYGHSSQEEFTCSASIASEPTAAGVRLLDPAGQEAETKFRVLERYDDGTSLLEARPITGRTNQIRLHLWSLGHPIVGDPTYLPGDEVGERQTLAPSDPPMHLHAWRLEFVHPGSGQRVAFTAPSHWANLELSSGTMATSPPAGPAGTQSSSTD